MIQRLVNYVNNLSAIGIALNYADVEALYLSVDEKVRKNASILLLSLAAANGVVYGMDMRGELVPFDFSRVTEATYFDKDLNLQVVDSNIPRIDYGNYSKDAKLLVEKASTNVIPISAIVADSAIVSNINDEKYGNVKSFKETEDNNFHRLRWVYSSSVIKEQSAFSILLKYDGRQHIVLRLLSGSNSGFDCVVVDLLNKVITKHLHPYSDAYLQVLDDGWIRLYYVQNSNPYNAYNTFILNSAIYADSNSNPIFEGDPEKGFLYATPQFELDSIQPTSYIPTTTSAVTRSADNLSYTLKNNCFVYLKTTNQEVILDKQAGLWNIHEDLNNEGVEVLAIMPDNRLSNVLIDIASAPVTQDNTLAAINIDKAEYQHIDAVKKLGGVNVGKEAAGENTSFVYYL